MRKFIRILLLVVGLVLIMISGLALNRYLAANNRLFYATGTKDKAFLNATWRMSRNEVERANNASLTPNDKLWVLMDAPSVMDLKRYMQLVRKDVMLWGHSAEIAYSFFDNKLYEYYISLTVYDLDKSPDEIRSTLEQQFGKGQPDSVGGPNLLLNLKWETPKQHLTMWMGSNEGNNSGYYVGVRATYKPGSEEIDRAVKAEKKSYF